MEEGQVGARERVEIDGGIDEVCARRIKSVRKELVADHSERVEDERRGKEHIARGLLHGFKTDLEHSAERLHAEQQNKAEETPRNVGGVVHIRARGPGGVAEELEHAERGEQREVNQPETACAAHEHACCSQCGRGHKTDVVDKRVEGARAPRLARR
eukprot:Amastigsp_a182167_7.p2 type:complete len:157 gc:universal Amastigsp_a182167_7:482-952(+)